MGLLSPRAFVSTPYGPNFAELRERLARTLESIGWDVVRFEAFSPSRSFAEQAREEVRQSTVMIADLTDSNPNVIYEVGLAHGAGLPVLLLTQKLDVSLPAFLQNNLFLVYSTNDLAPALSRVAGWAQSQAERRQGGSR